MPSYPLATPVSMDRPATGQAWIDLIPSEPLAPVLAPEAGELVFIGDGSTSPIAGLAPGAVVLLGDRSKLMHVLGFLDRQYIETLRASRIWGWQGGLAPPADFGWSHSGIPILDDFFWGRPTLPRPRVTEGQQIGRVSTERGRLRWWCVKVKTDGSPDALLVSPLQYLETYGLAPPTIVDTAPPPAAAASGGDWLWLALAYFASEELFK